MSDQRALLDECTTHAGCPAALHLADCLGSKLREAVDAAQRPLGLDRQTWEKRLGGTDVAEKRLHLEVDPEGRVRVHEAVLAQLLHDAGWERTA